MNSKTHLNRTGRPGADAAADAAASAVAGPDAGTPRVMSSDSTAVLAAGTRDRLIGAMASAMQRRGLHGVGLNELLSEARAPKGVLYHHFPGGKTELAVVAIQATVARLTGVLDKLLERSPDPIDALCVWIDEAGKRLAATQFERGCPLATVALESTADDVAIRAALRDGFAAVRARIGRALADAGIAAPQAEACAALIVATYEGGLLQARVAGDGEPLAASMRALVQLLSTLPRTRRPD